MIANGYLRLDRQEMDSRRGGAPGGARRTVAYRQGFSARHVFTTP